MSGYVNARVDIEIDGEDVMRGIVDDIADVVRTVMNEELDVEDQVKDVLNDFDFTDEIIATIESFDFNDIVLSHVMSYDYGDEIENWVVSQLESLVGRTDLCRLGKAFTAAVNQIVDDRIESRRKTGVDELSSLLDSHANLQRQVMALTKGMNAMHTFLVGTSAASNTAVSTWKGAQANVMGYHSD
tara:strand:- start:227 stop:784 length:558 start_codon:yes stop_codon:yes gene_type:complete